jgi:hypothetical protein
VNKYKGNAILAFFSFEHRDGQIGGEGMVNCTITRQVGLVGWCLVGTHLGG